MGPEGGAVVPGAVSPAPAAPAAAPAAPAPAGPGPWRLLDLWPLALGLAAAATAIGLTGRDPELGQTVGDVTQPALYALAGVLCLGAARRCQGRQRAGWRIMAGAAFVALAAYAVVLGLVLAGAATPQGDDLIPLLLAVNGIALVGLVLLSPPALAKGSKMRLLLDGLIAGGSLLFLVLAASEARLAPLEEAPDTLSDLLYPAVDGASLTVAGLVLMYVGRAIPAWYVALASASVVIFLIDSLFAGGALPAWAAEAGSLVYLGLIATGATLARPWPEDKGHQERWSAQAAIYVPFGMAVAGACYDYWENNGLEPSLFFLLMGIVVLVVARSVMLLGENRNLYANFEATDAFKTQLLRFISHEIANPLSPLKVQVGLLRKGLARDLDKAWQAIERSIGRLESLSRDVRLMALAETRRIVQSTKPGDLVPHIAAAVQAHQAVASQRGVTLQAELPQYPLAVPIDGERIDQVIDNLLSNALKFTPAGGRIQVRLWRAPGGLAVFEVQDSGAGMTVEQQAKLFTAFGRPQASTTPGLGLGLYLCKAIVDGHDGRITATSAGPGTGATFRVELPPGRSDGGRSKPPARPAYTAPHSRDSPFEMSDERPPDLPV